MRARLSPCVPNDSGSAMSTAASSQAARSSRQQARMTVGRAGCKRLPTARCGPNGPLFNSRVRSRRATNAGKVAPAVHQDHGLPLLNLLREGTGAQGGCLGRASGTVKAQSRVCLCKVALTPDINEARTCIQQKIAAHPAIYAALNLIEVPDVAFGRPPVGQANLETCCAHERALPQQRRDDACASNAGGRGGCRPRGVPPCAARRTRGR